MRGVSTRETANRLWKRQAAPGGSHEIQCLLRETMVAAVQVFGSTGLSSSQSLLPRSLFRTEPRGSCFWCSISATWRRMLAIICSPSVVIQRSIFALHCSVFVRQVLIEWDPSIAGIESPRPSHGSRDDQCPHWPINLNDLMCMFGPALVSLWP